MVTVASHLPHFPEEILLDRVTSHPLFVPFKVSVFRRSHRVIPLSYERTHTEEQVNEGSRSINLQAPGLKFSPPLRLSGPFYKDIFGITWPKIRS